MSLKERFASKFSTPAQNIINPEVEEAIEALRLYVDGSTSLFLLQDALNEISDRTKTEITLGQVWKIQQPKEITDVLTDEEVEHYILRLVKEAGEPLANKSFSSGVRNLYSQDKGKSGVVIDTKQVNRVKEGLVDAKKLKKSGKGAGARYSLPPKK